MGRSNAEFHAAVVSYKGPGTSKVLAHFDTTAEAHAYASKLFKGGPLPHHIKVGLRPGKRPATIPKTQIEGP